MSKPVLYSYFRSTASWRVRIALAYKEIEYDYKPVHLVKDGGHQHSEDYRALNPMRQVPTLLIDGHTLSQSLPIIEYLDETRSKNKLIPENPAQRAQARAIAEIINSGIQAIQNLAVLQKVAEITGKDEEKMKWGHYWIHRGFQAVEANLIKTSGRYCVGDEISIADAALVPQVYNATSEFGGSKLFASRKQYRRLEKQLKETSGRYSVGDAITIGDLCIAPQVISHSPRFKVDMSEFPTISRVNAELSKHPAFIAAHMNNQPDTPEEFRA